MNKRLNAFAERAAEIGLTFEIKKYGNAKIATVEGETLPEIVTDALMFNFTLDDVKGKGDNARETERLFFSLLKRYKTITAVSSHGTYLGHAYYITTAEEAEAIRKDKERKETELERYWQAVHARKTASA